MKYSDYKNYEDLPLFLNAELLAKDPGGLGTVQWGP